MIPGLPRFLVFLTVLLSAGPGRADGTDFASYDECILESLKGVSSDIAANAIIASCRSKFPDSAPVTAPAVQPEAAQADTVSEPKPTPVAGPSRELTQEELRKLKATLFGFTTKYTVTFENFNDDIAITEVTIAVWDDFDPRGVKKYTETMHIPPSESAKVTYEVIYMGDDQGWRWKVDAAKGIPLVN